MRTAAPFRAFCGKEPSSIPARRRTPNANCKPPTPPQLSFVTFNNLTCVASNLCTITSANLFSNSYPNS